MVVFLNRGAKCGGPVSGAWYKFLARGGMRDVSMQEMLHLRHGRCTVAAVGGNSFEGLEQATVEQIVQFRKPVVTHGNGPQVGELMAKYGDSKTMNECVAETQVTIGGELKEKLKDAAARMGNVGADVKIDIIPTRVIVAASDPASANPTKPVGAKYALEDVVAMGGVKKQSGMYYVPEKDWWIREVSKEPGVYRRVVASPKPIAIHPEDLARIQRRARPGFITIACGGGGVPYALKEDGRIDPVDAVIDKDLASALLAGDLRARELIISTGVERVAHNYNTPTERPIDYMMLQEALGHLLRGEYPAGSMGEKVEAVINALRLGVNTVLITNPESSWINFEGTLFTRGVDLTGRLHNGGMLLGNVVQGITGRRYGLPESGLQRWLVTSDSIKK